MRGIEQYLQVDAATLGALKYAGTWNASTNTPTLTSGVGTQGQYYVVSVAGSTNLDGETNWGVGDWAVFNGSTWQKVDGGSTGLLTTLTVTGNTNLATTSGNVGIGVTPSAWKSDQKALQIGASGSLVSNTVANNLLSSSNAYFDAGTVYRYIANDFATQYQQYLGKHVWYTAPSGTAGDAIGFTQAMTLDASRNLSIGQTSSALQSGGTGVTLYGSSYSEIKFLNSSTGQTASDGTALLTTSLDFLINNREAGAITFGTNNTERMRITSTGNLLVGTTTATGARIDSQGDVAGAFEVFNGQNVSLNSAAITRLAINSQGGNWYIENQRTGAPLCFNNGTERMRIDSAGNLGIGVTAFGTSAAKIIGIANGTAPTTSPAGMGQLYVEAGALKYRGSSGTITTIAVA